MSSRSHLSSTKSSDNTYQNSLALLQQQQKHSHAKAKRSNSTSSSPPPASHHTPTHSSSSLYKKCSSVVSSSGGQQSPPIHKASSQQLSREHSFDGSLYSGNSIGSATTCSINSNSRHGASFRRRGSAGINSNTGGGSSMNTTTPTGAGGATQSSGGLRTTTNTSGRSGSMSGLLMGGLDLIPSDNPPPIPPPLNLPSSGVGGIGMLPAHAAPSLPKIGSHLGGSLFAPSSLDDSSKPQPAPRKQFLKSESVETGICSGSSSNNSSRSNTTNSKDGLGSGGGTLESTKSCGDDTNTADSAFVAGAGDCTNITNVAASTGERHTNVEIVIIIALIVRLLLLLQRRLFAHTPLWCGVQ